MSDIEDLKQRCQERSQRFGTSVFDTSKISSIMERLDKPLSESPKESAKERLNKIRKNPYYIKNIKNPTIVEQKEAVTQDGMVLGIIKNPTKEIQILAIGNNGYALQFIMYPTKEMCEIAVSNNGYAITFVKNQWPNLKKIAIQENPLASEFIK